jgi:hypothetical protein
MLLKFCHEKIRTLIRDNFLKICEISGICGFNFGILRLESGALAGRVA